MTRQIAMGIAAIALLVSACEQGTETVGPRGGVIVSDDAMFSMEIPEGALAEDLDISIKRIDCETRKSVGPCYGVEPRGAAFLQPALVTYEIGGMELDKTKPTQLGVIAQVDDGWRVLADRDVDTEDEIVTASALYLSSFALVPIE